MEKQCTVSMMHSTFRYGARILRTEDLRGCLPEKLCCVTDWALLSYLRYEAGEVIRRFRKNCHL